MADWRPDRKLTNKQKAFVSEYMIDRNASQAALRAGYSPKTADQQGSELLQKTIIAREVDKRTAALERKTEITAESVIKRINDLANICLQTDDDGKPLDVAGANTALANLGKHFKLFTDKVQQEHMGTVDIRWESESE